MRKIFHLVFLLIFLPVVAQNDDLPEVSDKNVIEIESGKPVILVVSVFSETDEDASPLLSRREKAELEKNFPECEVQIIDSRCRIEFANNAADRAVFDNKKITYQHVIYWDGKKSSPIKTSPIATKLTEFVASATGKKKVSSYLSDNQKIFDTIALRKKVFKPNAESKMLAQFYCLNLLYNQRLYGDIWYEALSRQDYGKVKSATVFMSRSDQPEAEAFKIAFNDRHLVSNIVYSSRPGSADTVFFIFSYDNNGLLRKMVSTDNYNGQARVHSYDYSYDGNLLIETSDEEISEVYLENGMLMESRHYDFTDYEKDYLIETSKTVMEDGCKIQYQNGFKNEAYCASGDGVNEPYVYEKTLYDQGNPMRIATSQIERDGNRLVISNKLRDNSLRPIASVTFNKDGLIESCDGGISKGITYHLRVDYNYFE